MRKALPVLLFFFCTNSIAQDTVVSPLVLTHISEENGLSDNHVTCAYKDRSELLWVGTKDGLNLLNGSTIRVFRNDPADSNSICSNQINCITQDRNGNTWIGTANGFSAYNGRSLRFSNTIYYDNGHTYIGGITDIRVDDTGHLWLGTANGLIDYDPHTKKITQHHNQSKAFGTDPAYSNRINKLLITSQKIWLATGDGLWYFTLADNSFTKIIHKQNDPFYHPLCLTVCEDQHHNIWAGFWNSGLKKYEIASQKITDYGAKLDHAYSISSIIEIIQRPDKVTLWLNGQLFAFDEIKEEYFHYPIPITEKDLPSLSPVHFSDDGWLWFGSDNGLYIYKPQQQLFTHRLFRPLISSQEVVFENYKNNLLVGAQGADFLKLRDKNGVGIKDYSHLRRKDAAVLYMLHRGENDLWIGTSDGILHTDLETGHKRWFYHTDEDSTSLPRDFIASLFIDSKNNCWVFPWREGIWQMDTLTGKCRKMLDGFIVESGKTKKLLISDAAEDADGNIWMADLDEGIILYDAATQKFTKPFEKEIGSKTHTSRIFIRGEWAYSSLSTAILKWDLRERKLQLLELPPALRKAIYDIYPDRSGNWWIATAGGLILFNETGHSFRKFTTTDGLYLNDIDATLFCAADGQMYIGNPHYISSFDPKTLMASSSEKKDVMIAEFIAGDTRINPGELMSLANDQNNIIIRWALPAYADPLKNRYYYKLKGIDTAWRYAGNSGEVQYASLSSGYYTIYLKASSANGTESANILTLDFRIRPPFWKTWWFISLAVLAISSLFIAVVRYVSQRNLKEKLLRLEKEQAVEKERNRISRDMHDDLGSGLTKIAIMSEVVKKQINEPEKAKQQLENISESSRELVDNLQDIIWVLNPKNDTLESLAIYIREYGLKFFEPFGIALHFNYPDKFDQLKLSEETRRNIFLVIKETFNNIAKHAWSNNVTVTAGQHSSSVIITVTDDGKGFDKEKIRPLSNGLTNMKNRIDQIGGEYSIHSEAGKGTTTIVKIYL